MKKVRDEKPIPASKTEVSWAGSFLGSYSVPSQFLTHMTAFKIGPLYDFSPLPGFGLKCFSLIIFITAYLALVSVLGDMALLAPTALQPALVRCTQADSSTSPCHVCGQRKTQR